MKSEKEELMKLRYLYKIKQSKDLGLVNNDIDFKNKYFKDLEEFKRKYIGIKQHLFLNFLVRNIYTLSDFHVKLYIDKKGVMNNGEKKLY